jgi:hypothetical protein
MAVLFPIKLDGKRFFVNPTQIRVKKRSDIARVKTMAGTTFQVWPDLPDEIHFEGVAFGFRSFFELKNLQDAIVKRPEDKQVVLSYKFSEYRGYVTQLEVGADAEKPRQFQYSFDFVSKKPINLRDMTLGQLTGLRAEFDFIEGQLRGATEVIGNIPSDLQANVLNVGRSLGRIGLNIGRPRSPSTSSFRP